MKKTEKKKKTYCDFCTKEIPKDTPNLIRETVNFKGKQIGIEVRPYSVDPAKKRFPYDICKSCLFDSIEAAEFGEVKVEAAG